MKNNELEILVKNIQEELKKLNLQDGEIISQVNEHYRLNISPYRMTMELRFPEGIQNLGE
ncbi:hypothetical protein DRI50_08260 [candidate division KSB1 bacterium]|nr:MAG: hypothetical protein DRI50_08260 [candidate division KSB1 bacterium]